MSKWAQGNERTPAGALVSANYDTQETTNVEQLQPQLKNAQLSSSHQHQRCDSIVITTSCWPREISEGA
jgi:hypothetical protein